MDELKKYLQANRADLDCDTPQPKVWEQIRRIVPSVESKKAAPVIRIMRWAAAACLIALAGTGSWYILKEPAPGIQLAANKPAPEKSKVAVVKPPAVKKADAVVQAKNTPPTGISPSAHAHSVPQPVGHSAVQNEQTGQEMALYNNMQTSFTQVIHLQKARISTMPMYAESAGYFKDFNTQINQMEREEKVIKATISQQGLNNDLLGQLIDLYQHKLSILKQLQLEMNKTNNRYKQNRGPVDTTRTYFISI